MEKKILLYIVKVCLLDWFNKEANQPIAEQDVRWESQIENAGRKKDGARQSPEMQREARWAYCIEKRYQATWQSTVKKHWLT